MWWPPVRRPTRSTPRRSAASLVVRPSSRCRHPRPASGSAGSPTNCSWPAPASSLRSSKSPDTNIVTRSSMAHCDIFWGSSSLLALDFRGETRGPEKLSGLLRCFGVQRQDQCGPFGVRVPHVEVEDVYVVRAQKGRYLGEDAGAVLDGDGHLHVRAALLDEDAPERVVGLAGLLKAAFHDLAVFDLTPKLRHRPGERCQGFAECSSILRKNVRPQLGVGGSYPCQVPKGRTGEGERLRGDVGGDLQQRCRHKVRQVREGRHKEVVLLGIDGGGDGAKVPDETCDLAVVLRICATRRGKEVTGALEEPRAGV